MNIKTTLAALALALPLPVSALSEQAVALCEEVHTLASTVMTLRQAGASMPAMMRTATLPLSRAIVRDAYNQPRYTMEPFITDAVQDFADKTYAACLDSRQ